MNLTTLLDYLLGDASAIVTIASNRWSLVIGLLFTLSAGLGRNYQRTDLRRQPWRVFAPAAASLVLALGLVAVIYAAFFGVRGFVAFRGQRFVSDFLSLVGLFWMTAPLAWLYGIPFERFFSPGAAFRARMRTLGAVAAARVLLISQAIAVLYRLSFWQAFCVVMLFVTPVALVAVRITRPKEAERGPKLLSFMGAVTVNTRLAHRGLRRIGTFFTVFCCLTLPVWAACVWYAASARHAPIPTDRALSAVLPAAGLWMLAAGAIAGWALLLPSGQRRRRNANHAEALFRGEQVDECVSFLSERNQSDFPHGWRFPPAGEFELEPSSPSVLDGVEVALRNNDASWIQEGFQQQFGEYLREPHWWWFDPAAMTRIVALLGALPRGAELAAAAADQIEEFESNVGVAFMLEREFRRRLERERSQQNLPIPAGLDGRELHRPPLHSDAWQRARNELWRFVGRVPAKRMWESPEDFDK